MPSSRKKARPDDSAQSAAFIAKARELEADHESAADNLMGQMAKMKPEPRGKPDKPPRKRPSTNDDKPGH